MKIVEIDNLKKLYGNNIALDSINITINEGEIYGVLGPNGSGKSTLINIISGLLTFNNGNCKIFNKDIRKNKKFIQKQMSVVTQEYSLYDDLKAKENVYLFGRLSGVSGMDIRQKVKEALRQVELSDYGDNYPTSFSGGMKRRLNIACALVNNPKLLIMDEPTASLDPISREYIISTIKLINKLGTTIIYTSHYLEEVERICHRTTILNKGKIVVTDTTKNIVDKYKERSVITIKLSKVPNGFIEKINEILIANVQISLLKNEDSRVYELKIICSNTATILQRLLIYIKEYNIYVKDVSIRESSLEEVFFKLIE